ncbi:MAG TPA: WD40 repeat domain-containing serine/threonine protein kinase, partial [Gemmataceae bacterium]|nr:WD40 repeat domain-containing serine/threonine protein kinase [Gemmataceae bacterium]
MNNTTSHREPVEKLAEEFAARYRRGERPSLTEYTEKYPELADEIRELFPALVMMEELGPENDPATGPFLGPGDRGVPQQLGEFHILREVGRGGMGVVYEAVQESLGRHVALKVLPFHSLIVKTHLERFRREARAAARLHHSNIVPVFGVGQHEGLHYYAMQFIQGQGVDAILRELRRLRGHQEPPAAGKGACDPELTVSVAHGLLTGRFETNEGRLMPNEEGAEKAGNSSLPVPQSSSSESGAASVTIGEHSPWAGQSEAQYFRGVAQVGVQIAEALAYAHNQGVFHRDIKPSNLLLDTRGTVWITDFGLAKSEDSDDLTHPGDVVGTTRYMAPERFSGKADARSDLYSLGITLYELLTLRPAFPERHRAQVIERITYQDPPRPRRLEPHIPRDLETIVLKATDKEPARRYQTAAEIAADLRLFLADRPIQARRSHWPERLWRWCRRNPAVAFLTTSIAVLLMAITVVSVVSAIWLRQERDHARTAEQEKTEKLWQSYRDQARAGRWSGVVGRRFDSLAALAHAAEIRPELELRNEAIACMALVDLRRVRSRPDIPADCLERMVFDPSLERYAFSDPEGNIIVRLTSDDRELFRLRGPGSRAWALRFSPDGRFLAAKHHTDNQPEPNDLYVYEVAQQKVVVHSPGGIFSWAFSPDSRQLAVGDKAGAITVYDLASEQGGARVLSRGPVAQDLAFHPDGRRLAVACPKPPVILIRSLETGEVVWERKFTVGPAALAWHPEGRLLAVGCFHPDWRVHLIDTAADQEKLLEGHHGAVAV